jgi:TM2 domain-containing membrane protein YozV
VSFCPNCGNPVNTATANQQAYSGVPADTKSKLAAGLLGIFLGGIGVHNFYLGYTGKAIGQLLLGTVGTILCGLGPIASSIWGLVEGIMILAGSINKDSKGNPLGE